MALNISESNDLNHVLHYLLGIPLAHIGNDSDYARHAAKRLVAKSYKALGAGLTPDQVEAAWPRPRAKKGAR